MKISLRTTVITALTLFILMLALTILLVNWELAERRVEKRSIDYLTFMLDSLQRDIEYAMKQGDRDKEWLQRKIVALSADFSVDVVYLIDDTGQIIASKQRAVLGNSLVAEHLHAISQVEANDWLKRMATAKSTLSRKVILSVDREEIVGFYPITLGKTDNRLRATKIGIIFAKYDLKLLKIQEKIAIAYQVLEFSAFLGLLTIVLGMFLHLRVTKRIQQLVKVTRRIAAGDLTTLSGVQGNDEVSELARSLEAMATKRFQVENALLEAHNQLEQRVQERTMELSQANAQLHGEIIERQRAETELMIQKEELKTTLEHLQATQTELIQAEKMAMLGQLVAGIAHEINTPLGAIRSSVGSINSSLTQLLPQLAEFFRLLAAEQEPIFMALLHQSLTSATQLSAKEERQIKRALIRQLEQYPLDNADVMADTLVDMGIYDHFEPFLPLLQSADSERILQTAYKLSDLQSSAKTIETAVNRVSKIVFALKSYARFDHSGEKIQVDIIEGIETVLTLYHNQIKHGVDVVKHYATSVPVWCYPDELNQVWTNLIHNALQAMEYKGTLTIDIGVRDNQLLVSITDTGKGIPAEILLKIFQPFFTTKPAGEGSGLGLDIVRKILDKHQGKVLVESSIPGKTTFTVFLPIHSISSQETILDA